MISIIYETRFIQKLQCIYQNIKHRIHVENKT